MEDILKIMQTPRFKNMMKFQMNKHREFKLRPIYREIMEKYTEDELCQLYIDIKDKKQTDLSSAQRSFVMHFIEVIADSANKFEKGVQRIEIRK